MIKISVCVGSSCHVKGSKQVVERLRQLIVENGLEGKVQLVGSFCMGHCLQDVSVTIDGSPFSVSPEKAEEFFNREVMTRIQ